MAYINADYLCDVIGDVTELEVVSYVMYSERLKQNIIISSDLYNALDSQKVDSASSKRDLKNFTYNTALQVYQEQMEKEGRENGL